MTKAVPPWMVNYEDGVPRAIDYRKAPLYAFLERAGNDYPDATAIDFLGKRMNYEELWEETQTFARALQTLGVQKGDRVALMLPNCPQAVIAYYGTLLTGAIVVQTNPMYTERELTHQLNDSGARAIVCLDLVYEKVANVYKHTTLSHIVVTSIKDYLPFPKNVLYPLKLRKDGIRLHIPDQPNVVHWRRLMKSSLLPLERATIDPENDLALLQYTGGTTGLAKGVKLTHDNLTANTEQVRAWIYRIEQGKERILGVIPFFHVYGLTTVMNLGVRIAAEMILLPRFEVVPVLKAIDKFKPTLFPGVPTMYIALINYPDIQKYDLRSIEACISGAAPLPLEVQKTFEALTGGRLVEGYGLTEASPVTHANPIWGRVKSGSIGVPFPDTDSRVVHLETGETLPNGEVGELVVRGPQVMKGYWNAPGETAAALKDGWLYTGDMATMDDEGYFYIVDRKKDMIVASGFNVYPREVEEVLFEHESVQEAAVAGVPDRHRGETVKAFVVLKPGHTVSEGELEAFCRERLAAYKVPRLYEFRKELPKTLVGKVLRRALTEGEAVKGEMGPTKTH